MRASFFLVLLLFVFVRAHEEEASIEFGHEEGLEAYAMNNMDMTCECYDYDCTCKKECFCKVVDDPGKGASFLEEAVEMTADEALATERQAAAAEARAQAQAGAGATEGASAEYPPGTFAKRPASFRCGCDFGGVDIALSKDQGLECDCSVAKCACEKKCKCTPKGSGASSLLQTQADATVPPGTAPTQKSTASAEASAQAGGGGESLYAQYIRRARAKAAATPDSADSPGSTPRFQEVHLAPVETDADDADNPFVSTPAPSPGPGTGPSERGAGAGGMAMPTAAGILAQAAAATGITLPQAQAQAGSGAGAGVGTEIAGVDLSRLPVEQLGKLVAHLQTHMQARRQGPSQTQTETETQPLPPSAPSLHAENADEAEGGLSIT